MHCPVLEFFSHGDVGAVFVEEGFAVGAIALLGVEGFGLELGVQGDGACALAVGDMLEGGEDACAELFTAVGLADGKSADVPGAVVFEYASGGDRLVGVRQYEVIGALIGAVEFFLEALFFYEYFGADASRARGNASVRLGECVGHGESSPCRKHGMCDASIVA